MLTEAQVREIVRDELCVILKAKTLEELVADIATEVRRQMEIRRKLDATPRFAREAR